MGLGLVCPFLETDLCGIYEHRPFVCRQYLVTSPKELCVNPLVSPVKVVPMVLAPATAMLNAATGFLGKPQYTVPLTLALVYAQAHRDELQRTYPSESVFTQSIRFMAAGV
jgi:Fe-S-cluster containining protein